MDSKRQTKRRGRPRKVDQEMEVDRMDMPRQSLNHRFLMPVEEEDAAPLEFKWSRVISFSHRMYD